MTRDTKDDSATAIRTQSICRPRRRLMASVSALTLVAAGLFGGTLLMTRSSAFAAPPPVAGERTAGQMSIADLVERVKPAFVAVKVNIPTTADVAKTEGRKAVLMNVKSADGTRFVALPVPKA